MIKLAAKLSLTFIAIVAAMALWQQNRLHALTLQRIDPLPYAQTLVAEERYAEAASYLEFFLTFNDTYPNDEAQQLYDEIMTERKRWLYQLDKFGEGLWHGTSDETIGQVSAIASDFLVIGDIRDLTNEGLHLMQGEEVDEVLVALSSLGLAASGAQVASGIGATASAGAASPALAGSTVAKSSLITLKAARKMGKLPKWLNKAIINAGKNVKQTRSFGALGNMLGDVSTLAKTRGGMELLSKTTDAKSLGVMAKFAKNFDTHSLTVYRIGGDLAVDTAQKFGKNSQRLVEEAVTYGKGGLRTLNRVGPKRFANIALLARTGKVFYKGDLTALIADKLLRVPHWVLWLLIALGVLVWVPSRRRSNL